MIKLKKTKKKRKPKIKILKIRFCPKCNGREIIMVAGGQIGIFKCVDCGFQSPIFPEKQFRIKNNKIFK